MKEKFSVTPYQILFWAITHNILKVRKQSCYEEEGVEGWLYIAQNGSTDCPLGIWEETPPLPDKEWFLDHVFSKFKEIHDYYEVILSDDGCEYD
jgi:hypothetical protein